MAWWQDIDSAIRAQGRCAVITVAEVKGSAPREVGARLVLFPDGTFSGTIGGGALEWEAIGAAREALRQGVGRAALSRLALGPDLGQCCGGAVQLLTEVMNETDLEMTEVLSQAERHGPITTSGRILAGGVQRSLKSNGDADGPAATLRGAGSIDERFGEYLRPLYLFGAGHVGRALMLSLAPLPFSVVWIDSRPKAFPGAVPGNVQLRKTNQPAEALKAATQDAFVVVMTHSHPLDLAIVAEALTAERFSFVGLIGSDSKRARFRSRLRRAGLAARQIDKLVCPIGIPDIHSSHPAAIAVSVAAQLVAQDEAQGRFVGCATNPAAVVGAVDE